MLSQKWYSRGLLNLLKSMVKMFVFPQNSYVEILMPRSDGVRKQGLWKVLRSWGWSPHERHELVSAFIKEAPKSLLAPSPCKTQREGYEPGSGPSHATTPNWLHHDLGLLSLQTVRNECLVLKLPSPWYSVTAA